MSLLASIIEFPFPAIPADVADMSDQRAQVAFTMLVTFMVLSEIGDHHFTDPKMDVKDVLFASTDTFDFDIDDIQHIMEMIRSSLLPRSLEDNFLEAESTIFIDMLRLLPFVKAIAEPAIHAYGSYKETFFQYYGKTCNDAFVLQFFSAPHRVFDPTTSTCFTVSQQGGTIQFFFPPLITDYDKLNAFAESQEFYQQIQCNRFYQAPRPKRKREDGDAAKRIEAVFLFPTPEGFDYKEIAALYFVVATFCLVIGYPTCDFISYEELFMDPAQLYFKPDVFMNPATIDKINAATRIIAEAFHGYTDGHLPVNWEKIMPVADEYIAIYMKHKDRVSYDEYIEAFPRQEFFLRGHSLASRFRL